MLVATIDHLMPATEGVRGGKQIAPMLRLLTSDLVLDEPDDFEIEDQHALCRLVNWAGMLGGRVLLSSATLPPAFVQVLFSAYCTGRQAYQQACGEPDCRSMFAVRGLMKMTPARVNLVVLKIFMMLIVILQDSVQNGYRSNLCCAGQRLLRFYHRRLKPRWSLMR